MWAFVASVAVVLTAVQLVPQLYQSIKTRQVRDLSLGFTIIVALGCATWLAYGINISDGQ